MPHFMIVVSPYYKEVSNNLLEGAKSAFDDVRATYEIFEVSGALEIPTAIKYGILRKEAHGVNNMKFDGFVALGCIIRGETSHYDIVCNVSANGLSQLSLEHDAPIGNGILTCDTMEQAIVRADPKQKNKGAVAVNAALGLFNIKRALNVR